MVLRKSYRRVVAQGSDESGMLIASLRSCFLIRGLRAQGAKPEPVPGRR